MASSLFARNSYDRDPPQYSTVADVPSDEEPSDLEESDPGTSADAADRDVLREEEEREKLLSRGLFGSIGRKSGRGVKIGKKVKRARKKTAGDVAGMMGGKRLGMEEGGEFGLGSGSESEEDDQLLGEKAIVDKKPRKPTFRKIILVVAALLSFLLVLIFASLALSHKDARGLSAATFSNGTHSFPPTTIMISLDGMRADFLNRDLTPTLVSFINSGVSPEYMLPSFPSVTFPNHWTLATGLLPEAHGIVGNSFWDPALQKQFYYTDPVRSLQHHWWGGEPVWMTAERQGINAAVHMWPGSEAPGWGAAVVDPYNGTEVLARKVNRLLNWLDLPLADRPQFVGAYVPDVDISGHKYGPNSTETDSVIKSVDVMLHDLFLGLEERNLTEIVNIVIVSDHGMASTDKSRLIYLEDLVDTSLIEHIDGWPLYGLRPYPTANLTDIYTSIKAKADAIKDEDRHWDAFLRDENMPERWHFSDNPRIAPLWIIPETTYAIVTKEEFDPSVNDVYNPRGIHGYDNEHPLMRAIFVARGPAFRHLHGEGREYLGLDRHTGIVDIKNETVTKGKVQAGRIPPFGNWEVYDLVCESLGLLPSASNATLGGLKKLKLLEETAQEQAQESAKEQQQQTKTSAEIKTKSSTYSGTPIAPAATVFTSSITPVSTPTPTTPAAGGDAGVGVDQPEDVTDPDSLGFWDYIKWKTEKIRQGLEAWWAKFGSGVAPEVGDDGVIVVEVEDD